MLCFGEKKSFRVRYDVITLLSPKPLKNFTPMIFIIGRFQGINTNNGNLRKNFFAT